MDVAHLPDVRIKHIFNHDCFGLNSVDSKLNTISLSEGELRMIPNVTKLFTTARYQFQSGHDQFER